MKCIFLFQQENTVMSPCFEAKVAAKFLIFTEDEVSTDTKLREIQTAEWSFFLKLKLHLNPELRRFELTLL